MMTKYQLVFAKIECQVNKVLASNKLRELRFCHKAFASMKSNAQVKTNELNYRSHIIKLKLDGTLVKRLIAQYERQ